MKTYDVYEIHKALMKNWSDYYKIEFLIRQSGKHCDFKYIKSSVIVKNGIEINTDSLVKADFEAISKGKWRIPTVVKTVDNCLDSYIKKQIETTKKGEGQIVKELLDM